MGQIDPRLTERLTAILTDITALREGPAAGDDLASSSFSSLGLTSVDFLEFVLNVEAELNIDIPDDALLDPALTSVESWAAWLSEHADRLRTPAIGPA
ncbi:MAG: acyl carrier protein [Pseudolabrys sp.]